MFGRWRSVQIVTDQILTVQILTCIQSELVPKVSHPGPSNFIQSILKCINAAGWNSLPIQGIPMINYPMWKKYFLTSFWHLGLLSLAKWPHVPLLLQSRVNGDSKWTDVNPW